MNKLLGSHINAILATILVHMVIAVCFYATRINNMYSEMDKFELSLKEPDTKVVEEKDPKPDPTEMLNKLADAAIASSGAARSNIGVNTADKSKGEASADKYLQQAQQEMADAQKHLGNIQSAYQEGIEKSTRNDKDDGNMDSPKPPPPLGKHVVFKGPTNIYFKLENRNEIYLSIPVYKCEGSGTVVLNITVNPKGEVIDASVDNKTSTEDECFSEAAQKAALKSRFNSDLQKAPARQKGTITYIFVAQ
jgi:TonB family protein